MIYVGIDWSRAKHDIHVLNAEGDPIDRFVIQHDQEDFFELAKRIHNLEPESCNVSVAIESKQGPLVDFLSAQNYKVFSINPLSSDRARDRYRPSGCKDDVNDAFVLADMIRTDRGWLRELEKKSLESVELRSWMSMRTDVVQQKTAMSLKLRALLSEWSPVINSLLNNLNSDWILKFLAKYPLHQDLATATKRSVLAFFSTTKIGEKAKNKLMEARSTKPFYTTKMASKRLHCHIRSIVARLICLREELSYIESEIEKLMKNNHLYDILQTLPVVGILGQATLTSIFLDCEGIAADNIAAKVGIAPITVQSGKSRSVQRRRALDALLHNGLIFFAFNTVQVKGCWAHDYYKRKREEKMKHYTALRCIAKKWLRIVASLVKNKEEYDEKKHRANIKIFAAMQTG